ncbi:MAG: NDP-sugar synthase [Candidatus Rokubacteria bacterium]|nr:NDP-sugar synthase [Candidatus Rokubacteria bacterium]
MHAVILAGGEGTRLRPLTLTCPKPIVPLLNIPFLRYQLAWLTQHGIREAVLACSYGVAEIRRLLGDGAAAGMSLRYAVEPSPLGTAGALRNSAEPGEALLVVLNGDVLTDVDLSAMIRRHQASGARATIYLTPVDDPTLYGLVETDPDGRILKFLEKPSREQVTVNTINAGVYILDGSLLELIANDRVVSMEREFFPDLLARRISFFGHVSRAYWLDIGSLEKYRRAQADLLTGAVATEMRPAGTRRGSLWIGEESVISPQAQVTGPAVIGSRARLAAECRVEPFTVLGDGTSLERGSHLTGAVLWRDVRVGPGARLSGCLIADGCRIGADAEIGPGAVLGAGSVVPDGARVSV